jgi:5'-nucleotidase
VSLILVTNDDGIHAPGLTALYRSVKDLADTYLVAPDRERSASSHSLTVQKPLRVSKQEDRVFSVSGTPTDCVAIGVEKLLPGRPDLIISGINNGPNLGDDITYSGTVSAAIEGTILNIPSIAVSLAAAGEGLLLFDTAAAIARQVAEYTLENSLPYDTLLNVNVPNLRAEEVAGVKFTRQGRRVYEGAIRETYSPWGERLYWIGGGLPFWEHGEDTDMTAVQGGYVSITPLHLDLTNYAAIGLMRKDWKGWDLKNSGT